MGVESQVFWSEQRGLPSRRFARHGCAGFHLELSRHGNAPPTRLLGHAASLRAAGASVVGRLFREKLSGGNLRPLSKFPNTFWVNFDRTFDQIFDFYQVLAVLVCIFEFLLTSSAFWQSLVPIRLDSRCFMKVFLFLSALGKIDRGRRSPAMPLCFV